MTKKVKEVKMPNWKDADLADFVAKDLNAAIAFLCLIRDKPEILQGVTIAIEEWRKLMIENEKNKSA